MAKHRKQRHGPQFNPYMFQVPPMVSGMMPGMPGMPNIPVMVPPMMPVVPGMPPMLSGQGMALPAQARQFTRRSPKAPKPDKETSQAPLNERACLPYLEDELEMNQDRHITDLVVIDFDRLLLPTPHMPQSLLDKDARNTVGWGLGEGHGWWQSKNVLDLALEKSKWDKGVLDIAIAASKHAHVALVITTVRTQSLIRQIEDELHDAGVERVDHFACTFHDAADNAGRLGPRAKRLMLRVLVERYKTLERVFVYEGNSLDHQSYVKTAHALVNNGELDGDAFHIPALSPSLVVASPQETRNVVTQLVETSPVLVETSIAVRSWNFVVNKESRTRIIDLVRTLPIEAEITEFLANDILIIQGQLPPSLKVKVGEPGKIKSWQHTGYCINGTLLEFRLEPLDQSWHQVEWIPVARLSTSLHTPETHIRGPVVDTVTREYRWLRILKRKSSFNGKPSYRPVVERSHEPQTLVHEPSESDATEHNLDGAAMSLPDASNEPAADVALSTERVGGEAVTLTRMDKDGEHPDDSLTHQSRFE